MADRYPILPGAEPWSSPGTGERARIGIATIHGFTGSPVSMRALAEALAARGFTVELPRLPGHGTHWRDMMRTRYADWRSEVVRTLDRLRERCDTIVLVGLSLGGTLVLDVAAERGNDVAAVVSINAAVLDREGVVAKLAPFLEKIVPVVPAKAAGLAKNDIAKGGDEQAYERVPAAAGNSVMRELPRVRNALAELRVPVLVAWSRQDHSVPPENSRAILRLAHNAKLTELCLERSYHVATMDYDFDLLVDKITELAASVASER